MSLSEYIKESVPKIGQSKLFSTQYNSEYDRIFLLFYDEVKRISFRVSDYFARIYIIDRVQFRVFSENVLYMFFVEVFEVIGSKEC